MKKSFGEYFIRMVVEQFHKLYIRGGNAGEKVGIGLLESERHDDHQENGVLDKYINLRKKREYGLAVRFAILVRPHQNNFYSAVNMWHSVDGYIRLTSLNDRLFITPDIVRVVGKPEFRS